MTVKVTTVIFDTSQALTFTLIILAAWIASCAIYNVYFHPLKGIPGPWIYAISRVPYITDVLTGRLAVRLHELHEQYGPVLRIASNEISFIDPEAWEVIYSRKNSQHLEFPKNYEQWTGTANDFSHTLFLAGKNDHRRMRKILSQAFSDKVLRDHTPFLQASISTFLDRIEDMSRDATGNRFQRSVDFNKWFNFLAFDVAAQFVLGESFHTLTQPDHRPWLDNFSRTWCFISIVSCVKSLASAKDIVSLFLPKMWLQSYVDQLALVRKMALKRLGVQPDGQTMMSIARTVAVERIKHLHLSEQELLANVELVVTAGTDTSAAALPATLYLLARNPAAMKRATIEIRAFDSEHDIDFLALEKIPYLTACVTEALRMYSRVPEGLPRIVPVPGENICGYWVPGGTFCQVSCFASNRSSAHFSLSDTFIPERWLCSSSGTAVIRKYAEDRKDSFRPFSAGPRDCIGKNFAMTTIRLTLARLLYRFEIECATDENWLDQRCYLLWQRRPLLMNISV